MGLTTSLCGATDASSASSVVCIATPRPRTPSSLLPKGPDGARGRLDHPGDVAGVGDVDGVARLEHGHLRPGALGHPPRELGVKRTVLGSDDGVARLVAPGRGGQLGVEGSARYRHLRARHELGLRLGQIGSKFGCELLWIEEGESVLGWFGIIAYPRYGRGQLTGGLFDVW